MHVAVKLVNWTLAGEGQCREGYTYSVVQWTVQGAEASLILVGKQWREEEGALISCNTQLPLTPHNDKALHSAEKYCFAVCNAVSNALCIALCN